MEIEIIKKTKVISVLAFPYENKLEVRVTRRHIFEPRIPIINIYSAYYSDKNRVRNLVSRASELNRLVLLDTIDNRRFVQSPLV